MSFFDVEQENDISFDPIPKGLQQVVICGAKYVPTKAGTGWYVNCEFECTADQFIGKKVYENFNLENPNPMAVRIGRGMFKKLLQACGIAKLETINDLSCLTDKVLTVDIDIKKDDRGEIVNVIKDYMISSKPKAAKAVLTSEENIPF